VDPRSLAILEFPAIRARLAEETEFAPSRRLAEALEPSSDRVVVERALDETDEARAFVEQRPGVGVAGARDIAAWVARAERGGRLETEPLQEILDTLIAAGRLAETLQGAGGPLLRGLGREIAPLPALRSTLERSLDPAGGLLDSASPRLGGLRRAVRIAYDRLRTRLEQLVHSSEFSPALQEPLISLRNGRYVVPVRAEMKARVKGIVHDQSGSGQTLFIEPLVAVELGNAWREAQLAEVAEVERILDELSALVGANAAALSATLDALARFDLWSAKASLAAEMEANRAETATGWELDLRSARHPGLSGRVVPIDVRLGGEFSALVITGPNTGGKTVTLRTIGLLALMHQAGLHVPTAPGSKLPVFRGVHADIGDEQSIAQSLSTFSSHMRAIVPIVERAGPGDLVLLDELGAGTDPTEGSALARAVLDRLIRAGALVAATTHYAELKAYAHNAPGATNASVDFDLETLSPTYHLSIGLPGMSQAFAIAERLGMPAELIADARSRLAAAHTELEETLASVKEARVEAAETLERAREAEEKARDDRRTADAERQRARSARDEVLQTAREEADRLMAALEREIAAARDRIRRGSFAEEELESIAGRVSERLSALEAIAPPPPRRGGSGVVWRVGMGARTTEGWEGRVAAIDRTGRRATLEAGAVRVLVPVDDLLPADGTTGVPDTAPAPGATAVPSAGSAKPIQRPSPKASPNRGRKGDFGALPAITPRTRVAVAPVPLTLDLRGARVDEALDLLDGYLDRAALADAEQVTVVHGSGTGALRDAVRSRLADHPQVREWRPGEQGEGGDGATIVAL
jgi:DNA mismatch repair protein MutS2